MAPLTGKRVGEDEVEKTANGYRLKSDPNIRVDARSFKMSKSRGNVVNPDEIVASFGADAFRLYEMYMGPLESQKPWSTRDIVGMSRFLASVWRNLVGEVADEGPIPSGVPRVSDTAAGDVLDRMLHRTIKKVGEDIEAMRFNTAIAELIKLNNELNTLQRVPRAVAETLVLLLAPLAPHLAEELWQRLGHDTSLARAPWPDYDAAKLVEATLEIPIQVNGKLRDKIIVPSDSDEKSILAAAEAAEKVRPWLAGKTILKRLYVPKKMVTLVVK